jgi:hypothetical protein
MSVKSGTLNLAAILLCVLIACSCEFEPTEKFNAQIPVPDEAPPIDTDLDFDSDTIHLYWSTSVKFHVDAGSHVISHVLYNIDNEWHSALFENGSYVLDLDLDEPGTYSLKVSIVLKTGTGSIADRLGAEGFEYNSKTWTVIYAPADIETNMTYHFGAEGLVIAWKKCQIPRFREYRLRELSTGCYFVQNDTSFLNVNYVGQESRYDLFVTDDDNNSYWWGTCNVPRNLPVLKLREVNKQLALTWNLTEFSDNASEFQVFINDQVTWWRLLGRVDNSDTILIPGNDEIPFGSLVQFSLYSVPKVFASIENNSLFRSYTGSSTFALPGPEFSNNMGLGCRGFFFRDYSSALNKVMLFRHSAENETTEAIMEYNSNIDISANEVFLLKSGSGIIELFDPETCSKIKSVDIKSQVPGYHDGLFPVVSDNGICIFSFTDTLYAYDVLNDYMASKKAIPYGSLRISPDGSLFTVSRSDSFFVYSLNSGSIELLASEKKDSPIYSYGQFDFIPDQPDKLYVREGNYIYIKSCSDLSTIRSFHFEGTFFNIDFCSGKVLVARSLYVWDIYDFNTGNIVQTITSGISTGAANYTLLTNNTIYYSRRRYYLND